MKFLLLTALLSISSNAYALSDARLSEACLEKGREKILSQASALNCEIDAADVQAETIDNRWYNPSKYIWYSAVGTCNGYPQSITKLVQYHRGQCH